MSTLSLSRSRRAVVGLLAFTLAVSGCDSIASPPPSTATPQPPPLPLAQDAKGPRSALGSSVAPGLPSADAASRAAPPSGLVPTALPPLPQGASNERGASRTNAAAAAAAVGSPSILWEDMAGGSRGYYVMNGTTVSAWRPIGVVSTELKNVGSADFTGDGQVDLLFENSRDGSRWVLQMNGDTPVNWRQVTVVPPDWHIAGVADFDGDGKPELLWESITTGERGFYRMNGTTVLGWVGIGIVPAELRAVAIGDFTGDGRPDIVFENRRDGSRWVLQMNGMTAVAWRSVGTLSTDLRIVGAGDFTADGLLDLVVENVFNGARWILKMNGTSAVSWYALSTVPTSWHITGTLATVESPNPDPTGDLINGENRAGRIAVSGEIDTYTFPANQGEFIALSIGEVGQNTNFVPWIRLFRPDGVQIGSGYGDLVGQITVSAPSTGTYTVRVASGDAAGGIRTGDYQLTLAKAPGTFVVPAGDEGGPMTNGANHTGRIHVGDLDQWTFAANQGEFITVSVGEAGSNTTFVPWIRLIRPDGVQIGSGYGDLVGQISVNAPSSGTYTVVVSSGDTGADDPGDYVLTLAKAPGTFVVPAGDEGGPMTNGANHTGRINVGDLDQWSFTATQGEFILVSVGETGSNTTFVPWIRLIRPDGVQIGSGYGDLVGQIVVSAPSTGTYTVVVSSGDVGRDAPGNYTLTLAKAPGTITVPVDDEGGAMTNGANHTGHIFVGDVDQWSFSANQGEFITVSIGEAGSNTTFLPWIRLIRPDGVQIGSGYGDLVGQISVNAPSSGTYTVVVSSGDTGADDPGDYVLTLAKAPGTFVVPAGDEGGPMTNGANHTGRINLGDLDQWSFTATQGEFILVSVGETGSNTTFVPWIRLIRPDGVQIGSGYGDLVGQIVVSAPSTGTYTVVVSSGDVGRDAPGNYTLTLAKAPGTITVPVDDEGGAMTNGANHTGHIFVGDVDQWSFSATQGEFISLDIGEVGSNTAFLPWIRLIRPDGTQIGSGYGDLAGQITVSAPSTGVYTVVVSSGDTGADASGDYQLTLAKAPGTFVVPTGDEGGPIANNTSRTGHIHLADLDMWTFTATAGASIHVGIAETGTNSTFLPWIRLIRPDGTQIASSYGDLSAQINLSAPSSGTYTVVVASADVGGDATGDYSIELSITLAGNIEPDNPLGVTELTCSEPNVHGSFLQRSVAAAPLRVQDPGVGLVAFDRVKSQVSGSMRVV